MNVTFQAGEMIGNTGFKIVGKMGLTLFVAENEDIRISFVSDAGEGINYSKIVSYTDKHKNRSYQGQRFLLKYVSLVQSFSNILFQKYQEENKQRA